MPDLLSRNTTPAERARGCRFSEQFESSELVARNGGVIVGAPAIDFGATLDGVGDSISYPGAQHYGTDETSTVFIFSPDFDTDLDANIILYDSSAGALYRAIKRNNAASNALDIRLGNTSIANIPEATYSPYWLVEQKNVLIVSGASGDTSAWLNGNLILDSDASGWSPLVPDVVYVGVNNVGSANFPGTIHSFKIFNEALTAQEAIDLTNNTTYEYRKETSLYLPMGMSEHDPDNIRTLDISGNDRHGLFGDQSTPTTYPSKLTRRHGYELDSGDYFRVPGAGIFNGVGFSIAVEFTPYFTPGSGTNYRFYDSSTTRFLVYMDGGAGGMTIFAGGASLFTIGLANYISYWRENARNILVVTGISGDTRVRLNNTEIGSDTDAWTNGEATTLFIGASNGGAPAFLGEYHSFRTWRKVLTPMQIADLTIESERRAGNL